MATGFKIIRDGYTVDLDDVLVRRNLFDDFPYNAAEYTGPRLNTSTGASLDEVFFTDTEIIDQYIGEKLWTWGFDRYGVLGDGTTTNRSSPGTTSGGGTIWRQVSCGEDFMAAIKTDGTLWTWGYNLNGELGTGTTTDRSSPGTTAGGGTNWKQVSCGDNSTAAVKTDGTLWTWGNNQYGGLGDGTTTNRSSPGTTAGGGTNWKQVSCGDYSTAAVKTDGTLWTWGYNLYGGLGTGNLTSRSSPGTTAGGGTNWKQVSVATWSAAAIKTDGTLWTWGANADGQLGTTVSRSSPGTTAGGGTNWKQVSMGYANRAAAIKTDGTLWTWGSSLWGELGDGNRTSRSSPGTTAGGGTDWKQVSCGYSSTAAVKTDGTLWTWGSNSVGKLGDGTTTDRSSPGTTAGGGTNWKQVSCGELSTAAITYP
jgi:alpha-tubulin suppressor-like RCC1 family protein